MAITTQKNHSFPSNAVSDAEKASMEYGKRVALAIEHEWFKNDAGTNKYIHSKQRYNDLKLYARGEQSVQKYKDELSINGDLSYLNLDWRPVPIIPKFVDIVVNGISDRSYELKAYSQDPVAAAKRTKYIEDIVKDMENKEFYTDAEAQLNVPMFKSENLNPDQLPENNEELSLHMQLNYKQSIEIAEEEAINNLFDLNDYDLIKKRLDYDLTVLGIACVKNYFNVSDGVKLKYVDPCDIVYSYTESPYFDDLYYIGEVERVAVSDLAKRFPNLTNEELKEIEDGSPGDFYRTARTDDNFVHILNFEYKTYKKQVYKIKKGSSGNDKALEKDDTFNPPKDDRSRFKKLDRSIEVIYCGTKIIGYDKMLDWGMAENMTRPKADLTKVKMSYQICAPRLYKGRPESLVS